MVMDVAHTDASPFEWIAFNVAACMALSLDLLVSDGARDSAVALRWTCCWVALAMLFAAQLAYLYGRDVSMNFLTGYVVEESLSLDNLFQHKVLLYGILSAIVLRGGCIFAGLALIERFAWMLQAFGLLLLFAVFRILTEEDEDEDEDEGLGLVDEEGGVSSSSAGMKSNGLMLRLIRLVFRVSEDEAGKGKFFIRDESGRLCATPLMVALIVVEGSDIIFAADSIPAIFGVTTDPYVVYTSNICAILGLR
jgi:tellurite resistance protein TerC